MSQAMETIDSETVITHPDYNSYNLDNDFALVKLTTRSSITPVEMDDVFPSTYNAGDSVWTLGFGTLDNGDIPDVLHHVELSYVTNEDCEDLYLGDSNDDSVDYPNMMCAADPGQDSCQGGKFVLTHQIHIHIYMRCLSKTMS